MKLGGLTVGVEIDAHPSSLVKPRVRPTTPAPPPKLAQVFGYGVISPRAVLAVKPMPPEAVYDRADQMYNIAQDRYYGRTSPGPPEYPKRLYAPTGGSIVVTSAEQASDFPGWKATPTHVEDEMDVDAYIASRQKDPRRNGG